MSELAKKIKKFYVKGIYSKAIVDKFYADGWITEEEYNWILGVE